MSPVHVGEVRTEMDVQGGDGRGGAGTGASGGSGGGAGTGGGSQELQGWAARDRHARLCDAMERIKARTDGRGFDA